MSEKQLNQLSINNINNHKNKIYMKYLQFQIFIDIHI